MKHNKIKNTGIIYEILIRKVSSDLMNNVQNPIALSIIKEYFNKNTNIGKEYLLYSALLNNKFSDVNKSNLLLEEILKNRKKINENFLKKEKYNLVKEIKNSYKLEEFFNVKIDNYKTCAKIYNLFEYNVEKDNAEEYVNNRVSLVEEITKFKEDHKDNKLDINEEFKKNDKDVRLLTYKILVDKFNEKYNKDLNTYQKKLLKEYIYNVSNTENLKRYLLSRIYSIKVILEQKSKKIEDKVTQIKLKEIVNKLDNYKNIKNVKDENILELLKYYSLVEEINKI